MKTLIKNAYIVNEGRVFHGSVVIVDDKIAEISDNAEPQGDFDKTVDACDGYLMPGVIDEHVHFREPGLTHKADISSESRAAAYGGVTTFFDMPNTMPQTVTLENLDDKYAMAARESSVNYAFFFGATNDNAGLFRQLDIHRVPGIKLFMGASTGDMLVDKTTALEKIFSKATIPLVTHCENSTIISRNMQRIVESCGDDDPDVRHHPEIRSEEACYESTAAAVALAEKYGTKLHVAHISTARELQFFGRRKNITAEAVVPHLLFSDDDYAMLGSLIKCNPAVKKATDRDALRRAIADGTISTVATDHAPHLLTEKKGGCRKAVSGMPMVQFSLLSMLTLVDQGCFLMSRLVELMCHNPALLFNVNARGFIREGYKADLVIVRHCRPWVVTTDIIQSKCKWSPLEGRKLNWKVEYTFCNGHEVYGPQGFDGDYRGEAVTFR